MLNSIVHDICIVNDIPSNKHKWRGPIHKEKWLGQMFAPRVVCNLKVPIREVQNGL